MECDHTQIALDGTLRLLVDSYGYGRVLDAYRKALREIADTTHNTDERIRLRNALVALPWTSSDR